MSFGFQLLWKWKTFKNLEILKVHLLFIDSAVGRILLQWEELTFNFQVTKKKKKNWDTSEMQRCEEPYPMFFYLIFLEFQQFNKLLKSATANKTIFSRSDTY